METNWLSSDFKHDRIILAGDIGGTNTTLALVGKNKSKYTLILKCAFKSQQIDGLIDPIKEVIATARQKSSALKIDLCCISAAGPVENNHCQMTNCKWAIDGKAIKKTVKVDTLVINDFMAVGYRHSHPGGEGSEADHPAADDRREIPRAHREHQGRRGRGHGIGRGIPHG